MAALCCAVLSGCEIVAPAQPPRVAAPAPVEPRYQPSADSRAVAAYLAGLEQNLRVRGLMRTDGGTVDAPFTDRQLAENFIQIALFDEHPATRFGGSVAPKEESLRRWNMPVRIALRPGRSVDAQARATQASILSGYARRLSTVTGHPITVVAPGQENFTVFVVDEDERRALGPALQRAVPGIGRDTVRAITGMPREVSCLVVAFSRGGARTYSRAVTVIRSEHPPASWRSCLHEEVAQGLGLSNDSRRARPSIFNDDEEFALLTRHDELLLSMLYDPRLRPGMTVAEATPIVRALAAEKLSAGPPGS
ncbi:MAG: DUF2927 domain-containing protein [Pseudomonadota bacterium]